MDRESEVPGRAETIHPRTKKMLKPAGLDRARADADRERRSARFKLADWIADPANPFFARTLVNRYWKHFLGRGLVEPEDDMRVTNPPTDPELLDALAKSFTDSKFDLKKLVRTICVSSTYRLSSLPNEWNASDRQNYSRFQPRRLPAEVLSGRDRHTVTMTKPAFKGGFSPSAVWAAIQLPDTQVESYFLSVFGRPDSSSSCECERSGDSSLLAEVCTSTTRWSSRRRRRANGSSGSSPTSARPRNDCATSTGSPCRASRERRNWPA